MQRDKIRYIKKPESKNTQEREGERGRVRESRIDIKIYKET